MTAAPEELGLRERKRRATRRRIQLAVLRLTAEHGLDQVTIEDISRDAGVSPRTFFNYFPSKEDSLAGDAPFVFTESVSQAFEQPHAEGDPLGDLVEIMAEQAREDGGLDPELLALRRAVMAEHPQIFALKIDRMREFEAEVAASVDRRLRADAAARDEPIDATESVEKARLVSLLALTLARAAWLSWAEHPDAVSLAESLSRSYRHLRDVVGVPARV
ncbi:TetR/AcrR family transcriptional regulator [Herbiconiux sp.]|uniref:TetR/AcrR family transcriptional regulator n=1 Tax=Herbiconiux sp. TaxID=1871186 RepID=UPI0025B934A5|nr:TetR/AcrR family transcriptional regulator [Herbiconiux sp.]